MRTLTIRLCRGLACALTFLAASAAAFREPWWAPVCFAVSAGCCAGISVLLRPAKPESADSPEPDDVIPGRGHR